MDTSTTEPAKPIRPEILADLQAVADAVAGGRPVDAELARRVRDRSDRARRETLDRLGVQDIGVQIIREMRNAE
jgi:hypothetical protein